MALVKDYRSAVEISRLFQAFEEKFDLLQYKVDGWSIWPKLRFQLIRKMQNIPQVRLSETLGLYQRLSLMGKDAFFKLKGKPTDYMVKTFSTARADSENGRFKDIYFDDLLQELSSFIKIEAINNKQFHRRSENAVIPSNLTTTWHDFVVDHLARTGYPFWFRRLSKPLADLIQKELDLEITSENINKSILEFYWSKRFYKKVLLYFRPKYLFLADIGQTAIIAAAKEFGTKVIEFQHGFLDQFHPGYSWSAYALNHKKSMPVPDCLFLYGTYWQSELSATGFWKDELRAVGSLRMDHYRQNPSCENANPLRMVLTTQGIDTDRLIEFFSEFAALAKNINYELYVKLHPIFDRDATMYIEAWRTYPNIRVVAGDQSPSTIALISSAQMHLSIFSTCHYEAIGLGVPTVILGFAGHENVIHLERQGTAVVVRSPHDLLKLIEFPQQLLLPVGISEAYFKPRALKNMLYEIELLKNQDKASNILEL